MSSELKLTNIKHPSSGSNNLVLASDGSATATLSSTSVVPASIGGTMVFLEKYTANNGSQSKIFDLSTFTESFNEYRFVLNKLTPASDNRNLFVRLGSATGSIDSGDNYDLAGIQQYFASATTAGQNNLSSLNVCLSINHIGNSTGEGVSGEIKMYGLRDSNTFAQITTLATSFYYGNSQELYLTGAIHQQQQDDKAIEFRCDGGGNFGSGTITVYGIRNA